MPGWGQRRDGIVAPPLRTNGAPHFYNPVHIVILAWVYVIGMMALTSATWTGGLALFAGAGLSPVLLWVWLAARRARARQRRPRSGLEQHVRGGNDGDAESDQR